VIEEVSINCTRLNPAAFGLLAAKCAIFGSPKATMFILATNVFVN
jgi:hypothetical protein